jgi:hypothetical protein
LWPLEICVAHLPEKSGLRRSLIQQKKGVQRTTESSQQLIDLTSQPSLPRHHVAPRRLSAIMAATSTRTTNTTKTIQGTGSLEQDGELAPLAFEWKSASAEGATAVTLEVMREAAPAGVYRGTLEGVADAVTFDALAHVELFFSYSHDLNHFMVLGDHAALSNGLRLLPVEDALATVVQQLRIEIELIKGIALAALRNERTVVDVVLPLLENTTEIQKLPIPEEVPAKARAILLAFLSRTGNEPPSAEYQIDVWTTSRESSLHRHRIFRYGQNAISFDNEAVWFPLPPGPDRRIFAQLDKVPAQANLHHTVLRVAGYR